MSLYIALLGEQPLPAVLPLWQYPQISKVRFAVSTESQQLAFDLMSCLSSHPAVRTMQFDPPILLDAYDLPENICRLSAAYMTATLNNQEIWVNLTGGTKLMSLATVIATQSQPVRCLYVSTQRDTVFHFNPEYGGLLQEDRLAVSLTVEDYLSLHNLEVSHHPSFDPLRQPEPDYGREGDALEQRVESLLRESGDFDDVCRNVYIRKWVKDAAVINELDIVVTRGARLAVCSCKSGKNISNDDVYELAALSKRESAGIYCGKVLVIDQTDVAPGIKARARSEGVRLVYGDKIDRVADVLLEALT